MSQANVDVVVRAMRWFNDRAMRRFDEVGVEEAHEDFDPEVEFDWSNGRA